MSQGMARGEKVAHQWQQYERPMADFDPYRRITHDGATTLKGNPRSVSSEDRGEMKWSVSNFKREPISFF
jgi:hypothetical protein